MQYALVNDLKTKPTRGLKGICPGCRKNVSAKCGTVKVHHWAHDSFRDCDTWWEAETEWHRQWKEKFREEQREVTFFAENGEPHRADVYTSSGVTIEFQNSPISIEELASRENFYKKLIWVVNGLKFKERVELLHYIPNPDHPLLYPFSIHTTGNPKYGSKRGLAFVGLGLSPDDQFEKDRLFGLHHKELESLKHLFTYEQKYWFFDWKHKHRAWLDCKAPVFMDFGDEYLHLLKRRNHPQDPKSYFQVFDKTEFIKKYSE